jgi:Predicted phosphoribosyltransferases
MYFKSRVEAGQKLAGLMAQKYKDEPCAVVALSDGSVTVGAQIALKLNCVLTMLLFKTIELPRETEAVAGIAQDGSISYNPALSPGEIEGLISEYHGFLEQAKIEKIHEINGQIGQRGLIRKDLLRDRNVILVSDGLSNGFSLDIAVEFLKPVRIKKLIMATPLASVEAVDHMHVLADDIFCLSVIEDYISTEHYYDTNDVPPHELVVKTVERIVNHWKQRA